MARESRDAANDDSLLGTFRVVLRKFLQGTDDMLPAMVQAYDRKTNLARVQPLIQMIDTEGQPHNRDVVGNVPVLLIGGGTFFLSFNLPAGSLGWIKANDRDISLFLQNFVNDRPNTNRLHTFSDAVFIPDIMTGYTIAGEDSEAAVLQNQTGTVRISLNASRIKMTAPAVEIVTTGQTSINAGTATINASTLTVTANTAITGTLENNGVNVGSTHTHAQGEDSAGNSERNTNPPQ